MAPLAEILLSHGCEVKGSDPVGNSFTQRLEKLGITIYNKQLAENLSGVSTVVYSSAIQDSNPELSAAKSNNLTVLHRSDLLKKLLSDRYAITVAGSHGKTSITALITHMLSELGVDPTAAVGGRMLNINSPARVGKGKIFVAESDESDGSFLKYEPQISVLSNIEADHLDFHKDLNGLSSSFLKYLKNTKEDGCSVVCWDDPLCREVSEQAGVNRLAYGLSLGCDVRAVNIRTENGWTEFTAVVERDQVPCKVNLIGQHNVLNCLAALAVARSLDLNIADAAKCLESYSGVARRQNLIYESKDLLIYDDYAHNPGKISACLKALKDNFKSHKLYAVFQQHRYSRLATTFKETCLAFHHADHVFNLPVYSAGEPVDDNYDLKTLTRSITEASKVSCTPINDINQAPVEILKNIQKPAIIITVGAGDVWTIGEKLKESLIENKDSQEKNDF